MTRSGAAHPLFAGVEPATLDAPFGPVTVGVREGRLDFVDLTASFVATRRPTSALLRAAVQQLRRYFDDPRFVFELPLTESLSAFQQRVRAALLAIPPGDRRSYGEMATALRSSARAVGGACRRNPVPIVVPCHRVVARDGHGGFMGETGGTALAIKDWLLRHEQERCPNAGRLL